MDFQSFVAGSLGGFTAQLASYPFDTIKVRVQNQRTLYKGALDCFLKSVKKDSFWSLYRGMSSPIIGSMLINSVLFGVESNSRKYIHLDNHLASVALGGAFGGFAQGVFLTPVEVIKIQMQIENTKYRSTFECAKDLVLNKGLKSLTRGFFLTVFRETPACALYFTSFELMTETEKSNNAPFWQLLVAGGVSGCLSWILTYPIDSVKTRFQANDSYNSSIQCAIEFYKNEGFRGLWRGLNAALLRAFPNNAVCFATVAMVHRFFKNRSKNED